MSRRQIVFDGEGIDPDHINDGFSLADKSWIDSWFRPALFPNGAIDDDVRLLRGLPTFFGTGNRSISIVGAWFARGNSTAAAEEPDAIVHLQGSSPGYTATFDANTDGSSWRRDVVQVKIDEADSDDVTEDFEDAVTRAPTSTTFKSRRSSSITFAIKKGTDQSSEALADANEPAVDAGYTKYISVLIDNTGALDADKVKQYMEPLDRSYIVYSFAGDMSVFMDDAGCTRIDDNNGIRVRNDSGSNKLPVFRCNIPHMPSLTGHLFPHFFRKVIGVKIDYQVWNVISGLSAKLKRVEIDGTETDLLDFTSQLTADGTRRTLDIASLPDPLWGGGFQWPGGAGSGQRLQLYIQDGVANGNTSALFYVQWTFGGVV